MKKNLAVILSARPWTMNPDGGKPFSGVCVWFLPQPKKENSDLSASKIHATPEALEQLKSMNLPALCEVEYSPRTRTQGEASLLLSSASFVKSFDLFAAA